jgi:hypothetical protein
MLLGNITEGRIRLGEDFEFSHGPTCSEESRLRRITEIQEAAVLRLFQSGSIPVAQESHIHQSRYAHIHDFHCCSVHCASHPSLKSMPVK